MGDKKKILKNHVKPHATVEYLFVEKVKKQVEPINDDQGYLYGFINLFFTGKFKNDNLMSFRNLLLDELNYSVKEYDNFKSTKVDLNDYKLGLVDNDKNIIEFDMMDEKFYESLKISLRNLIIVGKNFVLEKFKHHPIFNEWFDKYCNRF